MGLTLKVAPTEEPLTIAEVMAHLRLDSSNQEPAPAAPTVALISPAAAGNVDDGVHRYLVTFVTAAGETQAGTPSAIVTVADKTVNGKVTVSGIPLGGSAVTSRKLYRTAAGGSTYLLLDTIADNTTATYTDNIADSALGVGAPSTNTTDDPTLNALIVTARKLAEKELDRALITQQWEYTDDDFDYPIYLPKPALISVQSVKYLDPDGVQQTLSSADYQVVTTEKVGYIQPAYGVAWPSIRSQPDSVVVAYTCGYGAASAVPINVKQWMLMAISTLYSQREAIVVGASVADMPRDFFAGLLDSERIERVF